MPQSGGPACGTRVAVPAYAAGADDQGLPLDFHLTGNEASDTKRFEVLLEIGPDIKPRGVVADKGYDANSNREAARKRGIVPVIPYRSNSKARHRPMPRNLYKLRGRIEQLIGRLKRFKRVAMRCEKTKTNYSSIVAWAFAIILVESVHTASLSRLI